jgi:HD superfamily phosphohydrolase
MEAYAGRCGSYGRYDLEWLISTCTIGEISQAHHKEWVVGFDERKSVRVVEQFLIARRALYETVYSHKTVRCAEGMMALFLRRLKTVVSQGTRISSDAYFQSLIDIINGKPLDQSNLLTLDDTVIQSVVDEISHSDIKDVTIKDLARRITERDLFKIVPIKDDSLASFLTDSHWREKLCEVIQPYVAGDSEFYFILDSRDFRMMSKSEKEKIFFINSSNHQAEAAADHPAFSGYRDYTAKTQSIFTVREAISAVKSLVEAKQ